MTFIDYSGDSLFFWMTVIPRKVSFWILCIPFLLADWLSHLNFPGLLISFCIAQVFFWGTTLLKYSLPQWWSFYSLEPVNFPFQSSLQLHTLEVNQWNSFKAFFVAYVVNPMNSFDLFLNLPLYPENFVKQEWYSLVVL
jgi:hypothetical protein